MIGTAKLRVSVIGGMMLVALAASILAAPAAFAGSASAPSNLQATGTTFTDVSLSWAPGASTGVEGYRILVDGAWRTFSYQSDSGSVTGLLPGRTYNITIQAQDRAGNLSSQSAPLSVTTPSDHQAPSTPSGLSDVYSDSGVFVLDWKLSSDNADPTRDVQYQVYAGSDLVATASGMEGGAVFCLDSGNYTFTVRARDRSGNVSAPSSAIVGTG